MRLSEIIKLPHSDIAGKKGVIFDLDGTIADSMTFWLDQSQFVGLTHEQYQSKLRHLYADEIQPKPFALQLMRILKDGGVPFCILSATRVYEYEPFILRFGINELVSFCADCEDFGGGKYDASPYISAAKRLGLGSDEVIVFEDLPSSARSAASGGLFTVGIYDGCSARYEQTMRQICDDYIYSLGDLIK